MKGKRRSAAPMLMGIAAGGLVAAYLGLAVFAPPDPAAAERARARVLAVLPTTATSTPVPRGTILGPSVLAQRVIAPPVLPPSLTLPVDVAQPVPLASADARREVAIATSDASRPLVYRLADGRIFVLQQTVAGRGRPALVTWFEETAIRGQYAQMYTSPVGPFRALVWWTEGPATYYLYSSSVTLRELVSLTTALQ